MIPGFNQSGVLRPFTGGSAVERAQTSPYDVAMEEVVDRFATSPERIAILAGLCSLRDRCRALGITEGFQWLGGSFTEDVEVLERRPPGDVDVVTFAYRPSQLAPQAEWLGFVRANMAFFDPIAVERQHRCDAYYIDLHKAPHLIVADTSYWFGLFSHRRNGTWKGMLRVGLQGDDGTAKAKLARVTSC